MGGCCAREVTSKEELVNSIPYNNDELINGQDNFPTEKPELKFEEIKLNKTKEESHFEFILNNIKKNYKYKTKIITPIELYNLTILYKDNYTQSNYIIFDLRNSAEIKEDFLKKMRHINYTYDQMKKMDDKRKKNFRAFLDDKIIILIISKKYLNSEKDSKTNETPFEIVNLFFVINPNIHIYILNTTFNNDTISYSFSNFHKFLEDNSYEILPYVLFSYKHLTTFYNEGYVFINFCNKKYFSFDSLVNNLNNPNDELSFENKFLKYMNITTMISVDNYSFRKYNSREFQHQNLVFKDINCSKYDIFNNKNFIKNLIERLRKESLKGHSIYFRIENFDKIRNDWIFVIIFFLMAITRVNYTDVVNYLKYKINFIDNFEQMIDLCLDNDEIFQLFSGYGMSLTEGRDD